jgi:exosome complex component RRP4
VKISPAKVPRLIGKKGSMIKSIEAGTHCRMLIGQNGVVIIVGASEDTIKAARAVNLVEQEAHSADLTEKVQAMLGLTAAQSREISGEETPSSESQPKTTDGEANSEQLEAAYQEEERSEE